MLESGDRKDLVEFLRDLSIKVLNATNSVKDGKFWHAVNKLLGVQQKIMDELTVLTNESDNDQQVQEDGG